MRFSTRFIFFLTLLFLIGLTSPSTCSWADNQEAFVQEQYRQILGREADPSGLAHYTRELEEGRITRPGLRRILLQSDEFRDKPRTTTRDKAVERPRPVSRDDIEISNDDPRIHSKPTPRRPMTDAEFLRQQYLNILGREPDQPGFIDYLRKLRRREIDRAEVTRSMLNSPEYAGIIRKRLEEGDNPGGKPGKPGSLDDLLGKPPITDGDDPGAVTDGTGNSGSRKFKIKPRPEGRISFETCGITHQETENRQGGDFIFMAMRGDNFRRVLLCHSAGSMGRNPRMIRYRVDAPGVSELGCEIASDNLPGWHEWSVEWGGGSIRFFLDGKQIAKQDGFNGSPAEVTLGGDGNERRNFLGQWRNFREE